MSKEQSRNNQSNENERKSSKKTIVIKVVCYILVALLGLGIGSFSYLYKVLGGFIFVNTPFVSADDYETIDIGALDDVEISDGDTTSSWADGGHTRVYVNEDFPIKKVAQKDKDVENILVFGVDSRGSDDYKCRADAIMIVSLDKNTNCVKLISLMRDTGVTIEGRSSTDKLTHSYAYGGVGLLINTINDNFGLDIQRFVMLDFNSSANIIDLVGGVTIDVQAGEVKYANHSINEQNMLLNSNTELLSHAGAQSLNGIQAIAWSRIRYLDSDFVRSSRQRVLATALMQKVANMGRLDQMALLEDSAGMFETNMTSVDLMRVGLDAVDLLGTMKEYRVPVDGMYTVQSNPWMMLVDWERQLDELHAFIWEE